MEIHLNAWLLYETDVERAYCLIRDGSIEGAKLIRHAKIVRTCSPYKLQKSMLPKLSETLIMQYLP